MLRPLAGAWPEQILAVKNRQKYRWLEHSIEGRSMIGVFHKWPEHSVKRLGNLEKDTSEKIT